MIRFLLIIVSFCICSLSFRIGEPPSYPTSFRPITSNIAGSRFTQGPLHPWVKLQHNPHTTPTTTTPTTPPRLLLDPATHYQLIDGFGGSFLRSGAALLSSIPSSISSQIMSMFFTRGNDSFIGAGFRVGKIPVGANDFGVPVWYDYEEIRGQFSIQHDLEVGGVIPYVREAIRLIQEEGRLEREKKGEWIDGDEIDEPVERLKLQATLDYPPQWMLNSTTPLPDASINTTLFSELAMYYYQFCDQARKNGVPIEYLSPFNEPSTDAAGLKEKQRKNRSVRGGGGGGGGGGIVEYGYNTLANIADLLVNHIGPLFRKDPLAPKLTWSTPFGRQIAWKTTPKILEIDRVLQYTDVLMYHGYDCVSWSCDGFNTTCPHLDESMKDVQKLHALYPDLKLWMTEVCYAVEFGDYPYPPKCPKIPRTDFMDGLQWGRMLFGDLKAGASAWIYWNLLLDQEGGPWLVSPEHDDPPNNYQHPLVIVDTNTFEVTPTGAYYFLAHFGRYVRPGSKRIGAEFNGDVVNVQAVAFTKGKEVILQLMNDSLDEKKLVVEYRGFEVPLTLSAGSITTAVWKSGE